MKENKSKKTSKPWLTVEEAAEVLERPKKTIYNQIWAGIFQFEIRRPPKGGRPILVSAKDLGVYTQ